VIDDAEMLHVSKTDAKIRPTMPDDSAALMAVLDASGLFPPGELEEMRNMLADYFAGNLGVDHFWITDDDGHGPVGVAYYAPERMTNGTWNLYLIAVHPDRQGKGRGAALLRYVEQTLRERSERLLLIETSGLPSFASTRAFYRKCGYDEEARIRDFYKAGDDKVIFASQYAMAVLMPGRRRGRPALWSGGRVVWSSKLGSSAEKCISHAKRVAELRSKKSAPTEIAPSSATDQGG